MTETDVFTKEDEWRIASLMEAFGISREEAIRRHKNRMKYVNSSTPPNTYFLIGPGSEDD